MFYIGLHRENVKNLLAWNHRVLEPWYLVCSITQVCSNNTIGAKNGPAPGSHILHRLCLENVKKIFLSETIWPRAFIFGMYHYLVDLYQVCSNYTPGAKNGPASGSHILHGLCWENVKKIFLSETIWPRAFIFGMYHYLVDLYQVCSNYTPGAKNGPASGSHILHR